MKRLVLLIILSGILLPFLSTASAQCINNGICSPDEKLLGCNDCSFGNVCVNDNRCTSVELQAGCSDCSATPVAQCINDNVCSDSERTLGNCADCQDKGISTGLILLVGGIASMVNPLNFIFSAPLFAMIGISALMLIMIRIRWKLSKIEGITFLSIYFIFIGILILINI